MNKLTRRSLLSGAAAGVAVLSAGCERAQEHQASAAPGSFRHLLEGIGRENLKITEVRAKCGGPVRKNVSTWIPFSGL